MGDCCSATLDENTRFINEKLAAENKMNKRSNKLLFLGPGGSGKSTIFKQLQWLHSDGFDEGDALMLKEHIYCQVTSAMKSAIKHYKLSDTDVKENNNEALQDAIHTIEYHNDITRFNDELASAIEYIWKHNKQVQNVFKDLQTSQRKIVDETTEYFWNALDRIKDAQYIPNETDIINVRYRTTGVIEKRFEIKGATFHIFDVGGQKSERKKWIQCFNEVKALIFVISLNCYNERMFEDLTKNCMEDSLELFDETVNNKLFKRTHIILFLNKKDLFIRKIIRVPITQCPAFQDFDQFHDGNTFTSNPNDFEQTTAYVCLKFEQRLRDTKNKRPPKKIYSHLTCAMDKKNIENVFSDVKHIVISQNLFNEGLS